MEQQGSESEIAGIVLAGGRSRRMGRDKAALDWDGEPMLARIVRIVGERCQPVYVAAAEESAAYRALYGTGGPEATWITDERPDTGPVGGLAAALAAAAAGGAEWAFVCATDMPLISVDLIDELLLGISPSTQAVIATDAQRDHPMAGLYRTDAAPLVAKVAADGERRMLGILDALTTRRVAVGNPEWLTNVNAPEDLHRLRV